MLTKIPVTPGPDGSSIYSTLDGDMIDHIAFRFYGREYGTTEAVLEANPHVLAMPAVLEAGVKITLPVIDTTTVRTFTRIRLFD